MKYPIWARFSLEARRAAATAVYAPTVGKDLVPRTVGNSCPIGVALRADGHRVPAGYADAGSVMPGDPSAGMLYAVFRGHARRSADAFMAAWDMGDIDPADLPALLEVAS